MPPPLLFLGAYAAAAFVQRTVWRAHLPAPAALVLAGWVLCAGGAALIVTSVGLFARKRTTIIPHGTARTLVTTGAYGFTRNPMYVGLSLVYLGVAIHQGVVLAVPLLAVPIAILHRIVIPFEEARLREVLGVIYTEYCAHVRRWL